MKLTIGNQTYLEEILLEVVIQSHLGDQAAEELIQYIKVSAKK
jgi:hypothetical protein